MKYLLLLLMFGCSETFYNMKDHCTKYKSVTVGEVVFTRVPLSYEEIKKQGLPIWYSYVTAKTKKGKHVLREVWQYRGETTQSIKMIKPSDIFTYSFNPQTGVYVGNEGFINFNELDTCLEKK